MRGMRGISGRPRRGCARLWSSRGRRARRAAVLRFRPHTFLTHGPRGYGLARWGFLQLVSYDVEKIRYIALRIRYDSVTRDDA